ncbi:CbiQ family ECF transporter T component [Kineococcus gypseus]|uniref:CbiQ family ECF transporter T component n=1 Tax=Kineococcus gypseus TaxID=1637102 RepID=UPI003D7D453D
MPPTPAQRRSAGPGPLVRHVGPLPLLALSLLAVPASFAVTGWAAGAAGLAAQLLCLPLVVERWRALPRRLLPGAVGALSVGWSAWLLGEPGGGDPLTAALTAALRLAVLVLPGALLLAWLEPGEAGDHLAQRLHLPGRVVVAVVAALGQLSVLADAWDQLAASRRARGLGPGRGPLSRGRWLASTAFGLLVDAVRRAGRVSTAMDARGAAGRGRRTWALPAPWRRADTACLLAGAAVLAVPLLVTLLGAPA